METSARTPAIRTWLPLLVPMCVWAVLFLIAYLL